MTSGQIIEQNKDLIIDWYLNQNLSQRKIAERLKVGKSTIGHYLKDVWEIKAPEKINPIKEKIYKNKEKIITMYNEQKMTTAQIGKEFNVSNTTIGTYLKEFGIQFRPDCFQREDLRGQTFEYLQPIEPIYENGIPKWKCKCLLCKTGTRNVITNNLKSGKIIHCGCASLSNGVLKIRKILDDKQIPYQREAWFDDFRYENSQQPVRFDFYINNQYMIEYDGKQHFKDTKGYFNGEIYEQRVRKDRLKNKYCLEHNIPLIRIPYTYEKDINLDILLPTKDNPFLVDKIDFKKEFLK